MTRLVLDTNIRVSGLLFGGSVGQITARAFEREFTTLMSKAMRKEFREVVSRETFGLTPSLVERHVQHINRFTELVTPTRDIDIISADPSDNRILECAVTGHADLILSGDHHLLDLESFEGIEIITPSEWLKRHPMASRRPGPPPRR